jgi:plastocyanin
MQQVDQEVCLDTSPTSRRPGTRTRTLFEAIVLPAAVALAVAGLLYPLPALPPTAALPTAYCGASAGDGASEKPGTTVEVYATGLNNPKGMAFLEGDLYVAESGPPGDIRVPLPIAFGGKGPIGTHARVSRIRPDGQREDFVTGLPNVGLYDGIEMLGATGLAVLDGRLYLQMAGHLTVSPALWQLAPDGSRTRVADVGDFNRKNPTPASNGDAVPMGNPYDLVALGSNLYITDGNYNRVLKYTPDAPDDRKLSVFAAWEDSPVTVGACAGPDGNLYVCQFSPAPYSRGSGRVDRVAPDGKVTEGVVRDLTIPIDVAFSPDGTLYVLQYAEAFLPEKLRYVPFGGKVLRVGKDGWATPVLTNLVFPTAMTFGPDGALYVVNYGNEANEGQGQILRVRPGDGPPARGPDVKVPPMKAGERGTRNPPPPPTGTEVAAHVKIVEPVDATKWGYEPPEVTIRAGQAVEFTNTGRMDHNATQRRGAFDTGLILAGKSVAIRIDQPGTYDYFCQPHPWMRGRVIVQGDGPAPPPPPPEPPDLKPPSISPWHAAIFTGAIFAGVFLSAFALRRRPTAEPRPERNGEPEAGQRAGDS